MTRRVKKSMKRSMKKLKDSISSSSRKMSKRLKRSMKNMTRSSKKTKRVKGKKGKKKMNAFMIAKEKARLNDEPEFQYNGKTYRQKTTKTGMVIYAAK